jgi:hypothetical protein
MLFLSLTLASLREVVGRQLVGVISIIIRSSMVSYIVFHNVSAAFRLSDNFDLVHCW